MRRKWLTGAAGLWLAVAAGGGLMWLEQSRLMGLLDPAAVTVKPPADDARPMTAAQLTQQLHTDFPSWTVTQLVAPSGPETAARVALRTERGLEDRYLNPYTGRLLARPGFTTWFAGLAAFWQGVYINPLGRLSLLLAAGTVAWGWRKRREIQPQQVSRAWLVAHASQTGHAEGLARQTADSLRAAGLDVELRGLGSLSTEQLAGYRQVLFVVSTFGEGEAPDSAHAFARHMHSGARLSQLRYGVLALGDKHYPDFCGFGRQLDGWLVGQGATARFPRIEVDQGDPAAILRWQQQLAELTGLATLPAWQAEATVPWQLAERRLLNAGSQGAAAFHIGFKPLAGESLQWQAGDIVEILPRQSPAKVAQWLAEAGWPGDTPVQWQGQDSTLAEALAGSERVGQLRAGSAQQLAEQLQPLRPRAYSIASLPSDGQLDLLIRQIATPDGLSLGSGWLTEYAEPGSTLALRVRGNPGFHAPSEPCPLILIGNGTGLASLRAHLKEQARSGNRGHWLIFGERNAAHDYYHEAELAAWRLDGTLARLDTAFSRDQAQRVYVQDVLRAAGDEVQAWLARGAAIYVCGSAAGMAPAVHDVLLDLLGEAELETLIATGRYRRDVY
ncbi:flavodoxin domain-containing protein [Chitinimonas sp.]|uniref:flavodoxin domain-containing protein n=1 Tax=Chitinimonas sp. TaxID=1934313 RepID=UPI002F925C31